MTKIESAAIKYAEKYHIWLKDAIPSLAATKSFKDGAEWMRSETINKAREWLYNRQQVDLVVPNIEKFINDFKKDMEEQQ